MATAKSTTALSTQAASEKAVRELASLGIRIQAMQGTAICVDLALQRLNGDEDREIAFCVRHNVVHELYEAHEQVRKIYLSLGGSPSAAFMSDEDDDGDDDD